MQKYVFFLYLCKFNYQSIRKIMRLKTILFVLVACMVMEGCEKVDTDIFRRPFIVEGDFDPVWGIPAAKWTVTTSEILGVIDSMAHFDLYTNDDGIVSLRYAKTVHTVFDYSIVTDDDSKNGRKGEQDSVRESQTITGMLKLDFFSDMRDWDDDDFKLSGLYTTVKGFVKGYYKDTVTLYNHGLKVYFDSMFISVGCKDGSEMVIPLTERPFEVDEHELAAGDTLYIMDNYDITYIMPHKPEYASYSIRMTTVMPSDNWDSTYMHLLLHEIGLDSITLSTNCNLDVPMQLWSENRIYEDTIEWTLPASIADSVLDEVERFLNLDSTSYIVIEANNSLPASLKLNLALLGHDTYRLSDNILPESAEIKEPPVRYLPATDTYASSGFAHSSFVIPIDNRLLKMLRETYYLHYRVAFNTSKIGTTGEFPHVTVFDTNRIDLEAKVVLAPHIHFSSDSIKIDREP